MLIFLKNVVVVGRRVSTSLQQQNEVLLSTTVVLMNHSNLRVATEFRLQQIHNKGTILIHNLIFERFQANS